MTSVQPVPCTGKSADSVPDHFSWLCDIPLPVTFIFLPTFTFLRTFPTVYALLMSPFHLPVFDDTIEHYAVPV